MKKLLCLLMVIVMLCAITACRSEKNAEESGSEPAEANSVDVDLTKLSSTMVYSEVYNMLYTPDNYIGKTVKMNGQFAYYEDPETKAQYFACIIADAAACCSQGIEFILAGEHTYPTDYPKPRAEITVTGIFEVYTENGTKYCRLKDATME